MEQFDEPAGVEPRDVTRLRVGRIGGVQRCEVPPGVELLDASGEPITPVAEFLRVMSAGDAASTTLYSYASALLRWWRFLAAIEVGWDRVSRVEVRDFVLWLRLASAASMSPSRDGGRTRLGYAPATINHNLAVLRSFYDERLSAGDGGVPGGFRTGMGRVPGRKGWQWFGESILRSSRSRRFVG